MASAPSKPSPHKLLLRLASGLALGLVAFCLLLLSSEPAVPSPGRSTARNIDAARGALRQIRQAQRPSVSGAPVRLDNDMLRGLAALGNDVVGAGRADAAVSGDVLTVRASYPVLERFWLNTSATVQGEHQGFPAVKLKAGRLSLPLAAGRPAAELARRLLAAKGIDIAPLDVLVRRLSVADHQVRAELSLPARTGLVDDAIRASGSEVDGARVARIYCWIVAAQENEPSAELAVLVRRVFANAPVQDAQRFNRAALVALSFYIVGEEAKRLAPSANRQANACARTSETMLLAGRADLAKHWAFSAALRAVLGERSATTLGEWKELSDSLPDGSGFSFVDLAADRSGIRAAAAAVDPRFAYRTARNLAGVTENELLPPSLLRVREGLSEAEFVRRYGTVEARHYQALVRQIDAELGKASPMLQAQPALDR
ncbi:MAG TPA: hypothetical protein VEZ48_11030 [Sphingomonadaceae bacterium]|jgi:uncharacterized protein YfiM (DUF2279 family)|nr:hypothetical protein [Sphingomonadaceae bacterium]